MQGVELALKEPKLWIFQDNRRKINILGIVTGTSTVSSKHDLTVLCLCFYIFHDHSHHEHKHTSFEKTTPKDKTQFN